MGGLPVPRRDQQWRDPGATLPPGSSSSIVRARLVIVSGPSGAIEGIFVYKAGTVPGAGNGPILAITNASKDPYGNTVHPVFQAGNPAAGAGYTQIDSNGNLFAIGNTGAYVEVTPGGVQPQIVFHLPASSLTSDGVVFASQVLSGGTLAIESPARTSGDTPFQIQLQSKLDSANGQPLMLLGGTGTAKVWVPSANLIQTDAAVTITGAVTLGPGLVTVGGITVNPTSGAIGNGRIFQDAWHTIPLAAGWSAGTNGPPNYRISADGSFLELSGEVTGTTGTGGNGDFSTALPAGYFDASNTRIGPVVMASNLPGTGSPRVAVTTTGILSLRGYGTSGVAIDCYLDGTRIRVL